MFKKGFRSKTAMTKCGYCNISIKEENLENHCKTVHKKPKLAAGQSTLDSIFKRPLEVPSSESIEPDVFPPPPKKLNIDTLDNLSEENLHATEKSANFDCEKKNIPCDKSKENDNENYTSIHSKIDKMNETINDLKASIDSLQKRSLPDIATPSDVTPNDAHIENLVLCKSLEDILNNFCELSYDKESNLLKCDLCCKNPRLGANVPGLFKYDSKSEGISSQNQSSEFRHLKAHLKDHFCKKVHIGNWEAWNKADSEEKKFENRCKEVGLRIARLCYDLYRDGKSLRAYEQEVLKAVLNGTDMGDLNHSYNFPDKFRSFVAMAVKNKTVTFLSSRLEQTGFLPPVNVQADKGTSVHNTRQFTTVTTVVPGSDSLISPIYLGQPVVKNHTGEGITITIIDELKMYNIEESQLEGGSFDGQYIHLSVPGHLTNKLKLPPQFICTWDPLHKIGVTETHIRQDKDFAWLINLTSICQTIYKKFNWGKNYQALVEMCEKLEMIMKNLKTFCTTRFPNSMRSVFDTLIDEFKPVIKCLEEISNNDANAGSEARKRADEAKTILRKVQSRSFVLQLSGTSDIYETFGLIANLCQIVDVLPYERFDKVMSAVRHFDKMQKCIDHAECLKLSEEADSNKEKAPKCLWPRYHSCLMELESGKFRGIEIKRDHENKTYFTKLTKKNQDLALSSSAVELTRTKMETFVKRLSNDLKKDTFDERTIDTMELTRNICDIRSFAIEVRKCGAVQAGHKLVTKFLSSTRKLTSSMDDIPDHEVKENFFKFLKVLEIHTKHFNEKELDSKSIIKDLLCESKLFTGIELTLHSITTAAVKTSVESVVESLVSRYETHFDAKRQLKEVHALDEMIIAENGPNLVHADKLLTSAMDKYWKEKSQDGSWHFCHRSEDIRTFSNNSKVVQKLLNVKSKFPFMDN